MGQRKTTKDDLIKKVFEEAKKSNTPNIAKLTEKDIKVLTEMFILSLKQGIIEKRGLVIHGFGSFTRIIRKKTRKFIPSEKKARVVPQRVDLSFTPSPNFIEELK